MLTKNIKYGLIMQASHSLNDACVIQARNFQSNKTEPRYITTGGHLCIE